MQLARPTRWTNPGLPQTLQMGMFLLYFVAASAVLSRLVNFGEPTAYYLLGLRLFGYHVSATGHITNAGSFFDLIAVLLLVYAGAMIASERKIGWQMGVVLAGGLVLIPVLVAPSLLRTDYIITWAFDIALLVLLLHPQSREHQKIWFR